MQRGPVALRLLDVSEDGRALVSRVHARAATNCLAPEKKAERDLSWFDASEVDDITSDGKTILTTEFGEGGGLGHWGCICARPPASRRCGWAMGKRLLCLRTEKWR